jgi:hypothetical protein
MTAATNISETAQRILALLEEAGEEDICLIMNTVLTQQRESNCLNEFISALKEILSLGYASMATGVDGARRLIKSDVTTSIAAATEIEQYIQFDEARLCWVDSRVKGPPYQEMFPLLVLTQMGYQKAAEILTTRGSEWWNPRVKTK